MWVEVLRIRVVDAYGLQKSLSCQVVVEEVLGDLKVFYSWDNPDLSKHVRVGTLLSKPQDLQELGDQCHQDEVGQVGEEVCVDA